MLTKAVDEYKVRPDEDSESIIKRAKAIIKEKLVAKKKK
jgi:hypothetical protein